MSGCGCDAEETAGLERRTLRILLSINASMFAVEAVSGWLGQSTGLLADSLDMLGDAILYGMALYAIGRSERLQSAAASASGVLQLGLGLSVLIEVARRYVQGSEPASALMISIGATALAANLVCLAILAKHRGGAVHMRALWICSTSDVLANLGVAVSGGLVFVLESRLPDLIIGGLISLLVIRGGLHILREAREARLRLAAVAS